MKSCPKSQKEKISQTGFTLIELSIVVIIAGLLTIPLLQAYKIHVINQEITKTKENIQNAASAINLFVGRRPCPSDRSLSPNDPNYGLEQCAGMPQCNFPTLNGICYVEKTGTDMNGDRVWDRVIIGGIPTRYYSAYTSAGALMPTTTAKILPINGLTAPYMLDGWSNKITYAVSDGIMNPRKANIEKDFKLGIISALNEHGNPTAGVNNDGQYVIISHGKTGSGAYNMDGIVSNACPVGVVETENCDDDTTFVKALGFYEGNSASYYDDLVYFNLKAAGELWSTIKTPAGQDSDHIINKNENNIGVNTNNPLFKLDVNGTIAADTVRTDNICDENGTNCFSPSLLSAMPATGTTPGRCPDGKILTKISGGTAVCGYPALSVNTGTASCGTGFFIKSIFTNGCIICTDGTTTSEVCP